MAVTPVLEPFFTGWATHGRLLLAAIGDLTEEQLALRPTPGEWSIWQLASHMAGSRAYWVYDVLGEGDPAVRDMFRVEKTTVPGLSLEDAGWEDDETQPRTAAEIVEVIPQRRGNRTTTRGWVLWHLMEHEAHHGGAISLILGTNGLPVLDL